MSFRHCVALLAACGMSFAFAADPPKPAQTTEQPQSASTSQAEGSAKPQQTEVAEAMQAPAPAPVKPGDAAAGQAKSALCAACHGMDGNPAQSQYPKLAGQQEDYIARQLQLFHDKKRENVIMQGFAAALSPQDMHDLGAYFASKVSLPGVADSSLVARGEALYRGGDAKIGAPACMACHGPDGRGNPGSGYPQLAGQYGDYVSAKLKDFRAQKSYGDDDRSKIMPMVAKGLSDADIASLSSYVEGLHTADADKKTAAK